jgi:hypothetical protein
VRVGLGPLGPLHSACHGFGGIARHGAPAKPQGCGVVAVLAQAVAVLRHHHLTVHSSRTGFASRLNSGVRRGANFLSIFEADVVRIADPLSAHTRSVRKTLLITSTLSLAVGLTGLIPTKIAALGVEFSQVDRNSMVLLLCGVVGFMLTSFVVTAASDFTAWRISFASKAWAEESSGYEAARRAFMEERNLTTEEKEELSMWETSQGNMWRSAGHVDRYVFVQKIVGVVSWSRFSVEFLAPLLIGLAALLSLALIWQ